MSRLYSSAVLMLIFLYIQILSIQPVSESSSGGRYRRSVDSQQLDVLLAVEKTDTRYFRSNALKRRIESVSSAVQQQAGVDIVRVFNSMCTRDSCVGGSVSMDCVTVVSLDTSAPMAIVADRDSFISPQHQLTVKCVCRPGRCRHHIDHAECLPVIIDKASSC